MADSLNICTACPLAVSATSGLLIFSLTAFSSHMVDQQPKQKEVGKRKGDLFIPHGGTTTDFSLNFQKRMLQPFHPTWWNNNQSEIENTKKELAFSFHMVANNNPAMSKSYKQTIKPLITSVLTTSNIMQVTIKRSFLH